MANSLATYAYTVATYTDVAAVVYFFIHEFLLATYNMST